MGCVTMECDRCGFIANKKEFEHYCNEIICIGCQHNNDIKLLKKTNRNQRHEIKHAEEWIKENNLKIKEHEEERDKWIKRVKNVKVV